MNRTLLPAVTLTLLPSAAALAASDARALAPGPVDDGAGRASAGTPQLPTLLDGYAARPSWRVAGVDYRVGLPAGARLKDPATISTAGVSLNAAAHTVTVSGSDVTLDGYDFGLAGGWGIYIDPGAANTVIERSRFQVGSNRIVPINTGAGTGNLTVRNTTFDGGGGQSDAVWALIDYKGQGTFVARFDSFLNAPDDAIDFGKGPMTTIVADNLFENLGTAPGAHPDAVQYAGVDASNSVVAFNTIYQPNASGMQGVQLQAQLGSTLSGTDIENNVIVAKAPNTMSYSIAVIQNPQDTISGAMIGHNYIDYRGAFGPIYLPSGSNLTFTGNVNMATGAAIPSPSGTAPSNVVDLAATPATGTVMRGSIITLALRLNVPAVVTGTPELALNTGGFATFTRGSGTDTLTFSHNVGASDKPVAALAVIGVDLPADSAVRSLAGNRLILTGLARSFPGLAVDGRHADAPPSDAASTGRAKGG